MDNLSLRQLKEKLIEKKGYTAEPKHSQLQDLKELVNDMISYRSRSGVQCSGHIARDFEEPLSLGNIEDFSNDIKPQICASHVERVCNCRSRSGCSCNSYTSSCTCNSRTPTSCDCQSRTYQDKCSGYIDQCSCDYDYNGNDSTTGGFCSCESRTSSCTCNNRTLVQPCSCNYRTGSECNCQSRTSSCGYNTSSCSCNSRCSCDTVETYG